MKDENIDIDYIVEQLHKRLWVTGEGRPGKRFGLIIDDTDELLYEYVAVVIGTDAFNMSLPGRRLPFSCKRLK